MTSARLILPGEPHAQGRPRTAVLGGHARIYDPAESRRWKADAQHAMRLQLRELGLPTPLVPTGPVSLAVLAVFTCPKTDHRKREPRPRRWHTKKPDADNVVKALKDAARGVLYLDDSQVVEVHVLKIIGAQGEAPRITVLVTAVEDGDPASTLASYPYGATYVTSARCGHRDEATPEAAHA